MENNSTLPGNLPMQEVLRIASSPAGRQLIALLQQQGGETFQDAIKNAAGGDYTQAKRAIEAMMADPKAQQLLKELKG